jgi:hypothetical protein
VHPLCAEYGPAGPTATPRFSHRIGVSATQPTSTSISHPRQDHIAGRRMVSINRIFACPSLRIKSQAVASHAPFIEGGWDDGPRRSSAAPSKIAHCVAGSSTTTCVPSHHMARPVRHGGSERASGRNLPLASAGHTLALSGHCAGWCPTPHTLTRARPGPDPDRQARGGDGAASTHRTDSSRRWGRGTRSL